MAMHGMRVIRSPRIQVRPGARSSKCSFGMPLPATKPAREGMPLGKIPMVGVHEIPCWMTYPIGSMYGIVTYIWLMFIVNEGKYTLHGWYGYIQRRFFAVSFRECLC